MIFNLLDRFEFLGRLASMGRMVKDFKKEKKLYPLMLQVQTLSMCNGRCPFCPYVSFSKKLPQGKMAWEIYQKIVDECSSFPTLKVFTPMLQNEPLLDGDIFRYICYFKEKNRDKTQVDIVTNGYLLNSKIIEQLLNCKIDHFIISLNAHFKETYEELMPGFKFEKIMNNINNLLSYDLNHMKVVIRFLETCQNRKEISQGLKYWHKRGVSTDVLSCINNRADTIDIDSFKPSKSGILTRRKMKRILFSYFSGKCCFLPFFQMNVLFNGDVMLCCNDWGRNSILGNVNEQSLMDIWNGPKANQIRRNILRKEYETIKACKGCSVPELFEGST